jgi:hypothetical protein
MVAAVALAALCVGHHVVVGAHGGGYEARVAITKLHAGLQGVHRLAALCRVGTGAEDRWHCQTTVPPPRGFPLTLHYFNPAAPLGSGLFLSLAAILPNLPGVLSGVVCPLVRQTRVGFWWSPVAPKSLPDVIPFTHCTPLHHSPWSLFQAACGHSVPV